MSTPKVSVIMAAYNHERYVGKAVESVLGQTYEDWEMIIIDDCSKDHTADVVRQYEDERIKFYQSQNNKGAIKTFNKLLELAQGEYVAILGSDDIWYSNKLEKQIDYLEKNTSVAVCFSWADIINEDGEIYPNGACDIDINVFNQENRTQGQWFRYFFEYGNCFCHPSSVVRKKVIDVVGGFDLRFLQLHDYYYWTEILQKYPIYILQEPLIQYRRVDKENSSISAGTKENNIRLLNEIQFITYEMIKKMNLNIFNEAFGELFSKKIVNERQLICAKYFVLLEWKVWGRNSRQVAVWFMDGYIKEEKISECLEEDFGYTLKEYYNEKAIMWSMYPLSFYDEYNDLNNLYNEQKKIIEKYRQEIEAIYNTFSWKVTKPLRKVRRIIRK